MRVWVATMLAALAIPGVATAGTVFLLDGRGWGHGIGMSQWGAEGYARHGYGYRQILAHYYPHTRVSQAHPRNVRVLLRRGRWRLVIGSLAPFVVVDGRGRKVHLRAGHVVVLSGLVVRGRRLVGPLRFRPGARPLSLCGAGYRGDLVVKRTSARRLTAVNVVALERYLRGVVPWEVPVAWHQSTYEAQAVAARSYTLATLHAGADFDLYPDTRSQMYGGIRAERYETNIAVGATAGQVLTWRGVVIPAYHFSTSGGRTSSLHDAWPKAKQVPYLVSVRDPYDAISPRHVWPTRVVSARWVGRKLGLRGVRDARIVRNSSGRVGTLRVRWARGWKSFLGKHVRSDLGLGSTAFTLRPLTLDPPPRRQLSASRVTVHGVARGLRHVRIEALVGGAWRTVANVHPRRGGRLAVTIRTRRPLRLRLAVGRFTGDAVSYRR